MTAESASPRPDSPADLDFPSFTAYALERTRSLSEDLDADAAVFVMTLYRATSTIVYDLESGVHRPRGLSWSGFRLLFALWVAGSLEAKDAARLSGMSRQAASALADTLEKAGLLLRERAPHDGRVVTFSLTDSGQQAIEDGYHAHNQRERAWADLLSDEERTAVVSAMRKLLEAGANPEARRRT